MLHGYLLVHEAGDDAGDVLMSELLEKPLLSLPPVELVLAGIDPVLQLRVVAEDEDEHLLRLLEWAAVAQIHSAGDEYSQHQAQFTK